MDGEGDRARRGGAGPLRSQSQRRLRHRRAIGQGRRQGLDGGGRAPACRGRRAHRGRQARRRSDRLRLARTLRPRERTRPGLHRLAAGSETRAGRDCVEGPRSAHLGQGHSPPSPRGHRSHSRGRARGRPALAFGLADPASARPPADHAQARLVDRRQDRLAFGRVQMDHRRGCSPPRPSRSAPIPT